MPCDKLDFKVALLLLATSLATGLVLLHKSTRETVSAQELEVSTITFDIACVLQLPTDSCMQHA